MENRKEAVQAVGGHRSMVLESFNGGSRQIKMFRPSPDISIDPKYRLFGVCVCANLEKAYTDVSAWLSPEDQGGRKSSAFTTDQV